MHGSQLGKTWLSNMYIKRLRLINEGSSISSHVDDSLLGQLPNCFVESSDFSRDFSDALHRSIISNQFVFHLRIPETSFSQVFQKMGIYDLN